MTDLVNVLDTDETVSLQNELVTETDVRENANADGIADTIVVLLKPVNKRYTVVHPQSRKDQRALNLLLC